MNDGDDSTVYVYWQRKRKRSDASLDMGHAAGNPEFLDLRQLNTKGATSIFLVSKWPAGQTVDTYLF